MPPPVWPRSAQLAAWCLMVLCVCLMGRHLFTMRAGSTRPTEVALHLDLNRADRTELRQLPGIGAALARRIEEYRLAHGRFGSVEDLRNVPGIGPARLEVLRPFVSVEPLVVEVEPDGDVAPTEATTSRPKEKSAGDVYPVRLKKEPPLAGRIDLNTATEEQLRKLPGIGPKLSERILETRRLRPFESVDDLRRVPGIGPKTLERLRPFVTVASTAEKAAMAR